MLTIRHVKALAAFIDRQPAYIANHVQIPIIHQDHRVRTYCTPTRNGGINVVPVEWQEVDGVWVGIAPNMVFVDDGEGESE